jgi:hypothetical protein
MSNLNNIEKMLQFATIEQMYKLLQSMKTDVCNSDENITTNDNHSKLINDKMFQDLNERVNNIHNKLDTILNYITVATDTNAKNQVLLFNLASELNMNIAQKNVLQAEYNIGINTNLQSQSKPTTSLPSQQLMTDFYAPASKGVQLSESATKQIRLEIKEKTTEDEETDEETDEEDINPALITCSKVNIKKEEYDEVVSLGGVEIENDVSVTTPTDNEEDEEQSVGEELGEHEETDLEEVKENNEEEHEEELAEEDNEEEESEEEVGTDEEVDEEPVKEENKQPVNNQKEEEEEEELELFEIEIDDVTYFATDEENGTLYAVLDNGEVGNKVGIIKDGEPIFN